MITSPFLQGGTGASSPEFASDLQTTLVPRSSGGDNAPTFTRATVAYQTDFEGKLNLVPSGVARMQGARGVRNLATNSETLTADGGWTLYLGTSVVGATDPDGGTTAYTFTATDSGAEIYQQSALGASSVGLISVWMRRRTGTGLVKLYNAVGGAIDLTSVLTASWQRFSIPAVANDGVHGYINPRIDTSGDAIDWWHPQMEDVTGQTNQNPSEYVSVGVLSDPWHGAGADGFKWFNTLNGNTVVDNVVTEATGAMIVSGIAEVPATAPVDASGPYGYLAEGARENLCLQSQTLGTTWVPAAGQMKSVVADQYVAPDGTTTMDKLQTDDATGVHYIVQTVNVTNVTHTVSIYVKYVNHRWIMLQLSDGTTNFIGSFDLLNGIAGELAANTTSSIKTTAYAGVFRISVTATLGANAAGNVAICMNETDTASAESWDAAGTETMGVWGAQLEAASFGSSYIPTTTAAVTRNADVLTYLYSGNFGATTASVYFEGYISIPTGVVPDANLTYMAAGLSSGDQNISLDKFSATNLAFRGNGLNADTGLTPSYNAIHKIAASATASTVTVVLDGGTPYVNTGATGFVAADIIGVGNNRAGGDQLFGTTRNLRIYQRALPEGTLAAMTA